MIQKLSYALIVIGLLGFITLIPGFFDKAEYVYYRAKGGSLMELNSKCFSVPDGWVISSVDKKVDLKTFSLRTEIDGRYYFVTVIAGKSSSIPGFTNLKPIKMMDGKYSIYEISKLPSNNSVRYWAIAPDKNLIVMGRDINMLESLLGGVMSQSCQ